LLGLTATLAEISTHRRLKHGNEPLKAQSTRGGGQEGIQTLIRL